MHKFFNKEMYVLHENLQLYLRLGLKQKNMLVLEFKNAVCSEKMENFRNRIDVRFVSDKRYYVKWTSKPSYMLKSI